MPRTKLLTSLTYSPTNPSSETAIRQQIDGSIQEVYDAASKATDTVNLTGNQTIADIKTFSSSPIVPIPTTDYQVAPKKYVNDTYTALTLAAVNDGSILDVKLSNTAGQIKDVVAEHTRQISDLHVNVKDFGAIGDGVTNDATAIQNAINASTTGDCIFFPSGIYLINSVINWNKKVNLITENRAVIKAGALMDSMIKATGFTTYSNVDLGGVYLDASNLANHCLKLDGTGSYLVRVVVENVECRNAILDGIIILPPAWTVTIRNCLSNSNGRDGLRSIILGSPGVNQLNHFLIDGCTLNDNLGSGLNVFGVIYTVKNCDVENNVYGIKLDTTQCVDNYNSFHVNLIENYIEGNTTNQIYVNSTTGDGIIVNIEKNYINSANLGAEIIKCVGIVEAITLNMSENRFESSVTNITYLDGGNSLTSSSFIKGDLYLNESKFINLGLAKINYDNFEFIHLPSTISNAPSNSIYETSDIVLLTPKKVVYPILNDMQLKMMKLLKASIVTNAANYNITCKVEIVNQSGAVAANLALSIIGTANQDWAVFLTNEWGYYRVPKEHIVVISFEINSITPGAYLVIQKVFLNYV